MPRYTHRMTNSPEYGIYCSMLKRCYNMKHAKYHMYGGKGITVCDRWLESFENFYADMGPRPSERHSLDRKENDKGYSLDNCRWATYEEQNTNRSNVVFIEYMGESLTVPQWAEKTGIKITTIRRRLAIGWTVEDTLSTKTRRYRTN